MHKPISVVFVVFPLFLIFKLFFNLHFNLFHFLNFLWGFLCPLILRAFLIGAEVYRMRLFCA